MYVANINKKYSTNFFNDIHILCVYICMYIYQASSCYTFTNFMFILYIAVYVLYLIFIKLISQ